MRILNYNVYSGPITRVIDGAGALYVAGLFFALDGRTKTDFGFHIFKRTGSTWEMVSTQVKCSGHGTISQDGYWIAINNDGQDFETDRIPGFVAPAAVAAAPIVVPASSPLWQLWRGMKTLPDGSKQPYDASDFDTDAEDAQRVGKQLAALNILIDTLVAAGIIVKGAHTTFLPIVEK